MKILYIEDSFELGQITHDLLCSNGHEVTWVQNRQQIPHILTTYELVISDFDVPGGTFEETRDACHVQGIPLLLTSGNPCAEYKNSCPKPFSIDQLVQTIEQVVERAG